MIKVPIEPYWFNAVEWWMTTNNDNIIEFNNWLTSQGAIVIERTQFYPWVDFDTEENAVLFILMWG
jgi:hypothetical protein